MICYTTSTTTADGSPCIDRYLIDLSTSAHDLEGLEWRERGTQRESGVECIELQFQFDDVLYVLSFSILLHIYIGL